MKNVSSKPVLKCQISKSKKLKSIIFLGYLPPVNTLRKLNDEVMDKYKFATITFEHDCKKKLHHTQKFWQEKFISVLFIFSSRKKYHKSKFFVKISV